ncbi:hypothetical protein ACHAXM_002466 [Skeletonema potamos]
MTQQVDEMLLNMEDSDDDDDSNNGIDNMQGQLLNDHSAAAAASMTTKVDRHENYCCARTPPPTTAAAATEDVTHGRNKKQKLSLLDSGDVLATISKVKRRRRHTAAIDQNDDSIDNSRVEQIFSTSLPSSGGAGSKLKRHHSLVPRGERYGSGRMISGGKLLSSHRETTRADFGNNNEEVNDDDDDDGVENLLKEIEQGLDQVCSSSGGSQKNCIETMGGESGSCPKSTTATTTTTAAAAIETSNNAHSFASRNDGGNEMKKIGSSSSSSIQPFGIKNANAINAQRQSTTITTISTCGAAKNETTNLCSRNSSGGGGNNNNNNDTAVFTAPSCPLPAVSTSTNNVENENEADNASYDFDNDDEELEYMRGLSGDATSSSQTLQANNCTNNSTPAPAAVTATTSVMLQCPPPATTKTTSSLSNIEVTVQPDDNGSYGFLDNDGDDDEWANVDLSGTQQQCPADNQTNTEVDDGVDFDDDIDFLELDKQVEQRLETIGNSDVVVPPLPPTAPIHNRRCDTISNLSKEPLFLSFTRYVVRRVRDDLNTYTKTIDVSLWTPHQEESAQEDELERLKKIFSSNDNSANISIDGCIHLRGEWYHTNAKSGDVVHLCSISGTYLTDVTALPVILHSNPPEGSDDHDDLVLVIHPDELITPTLVSEAVKCPRLAVLQSRLGSTGLSAKSAVIGTLRHDLFERCLREKDTSRRSAALFTREIIRNNAEALVGCGITDRKEAFSEVMKTLPQITSFFDMYTSWNTTKKGRQGMMTSTRHGGALLKGMFPPYDAFLSVDQVFATEEWALVPELGLKGNVDATVLGRINPVHSSTSTNTDDIERDALIPVELKTGHNQNPQHNHLAQLSVYTIMLRARHGSAFNGDTYTSPSLNNEEASEGIERGAASSGMLLYLNDKSLCARHVKPSLSDIKTLVGQRNGIVCDVLNAARPRGIALEYQEGKKSQVIVNDPPQSALPPLLSNTSSCERCYKNRECMMYTSADNACKKSSPNAPRSNLPHRRLIDHFTGHLKGTDLDYFRRWDRLIDLERHASPSDIAKSWLYDSDEKETNDGKCISSVILDETHLSATLVKSNDCGADGDATVRFRRSSDSKMKQPITNLHFEAGTYVIIRTDEASSSTQRKQSGDKCRTRGRRILIFRGTVASMTETSIDVVLQQKDVIRLRPRNGNHSMFRIDRDELSNGAGLLLQNLVNFFTLDIPPFSTEALGQTPLKMKQLTQNTDSSARRRRLTNSIIRLEPPPRFNAVSDEDLFSEDVSFLDVPGCDKSSLKRDFQKLNSDQKAAVLKVISAEDFAIIQGLPGTGKSATIVFITRLLVARGKRVLLTSYTHSAVDNLLCKLMKSGVNASDLFPNPIVRIGRESSSHESVHVLLAQNIACEAERQESNEASPTFTKPNADILFNVVTSARVVGVSALTAPRSPLLAGQKFDVVIVDEAGQISQPAILGAIMAADSFVLVGDHMQLPPLVVSEVADQAGKSLDVYDEENFLLWKSSLLANYLICIKVMVYLCSCILLRKEDFPMLWLN